MIIAAPASRLDEVLARRPSHVVSLISPDAEAPELPSVEHLVLRFHDIGEEREGLIAPNDTVVERLLRFAVEWRGAAPLAIHCYAGVSRSPAAAYILACVRSGPGSEQALATILRTVSPQATPNPLMVSLADDILCRQGAMRRAIAGIGRGAEAFEGPVFALPA